ncbi:MAG: lysylphosphatidylglycerol synthase transmembrane domain-containing protein, partial [Candidatus Omnitrophica bacterium]|nr:lysylphosphatidylglycerol synthase transmembrane domain-containing protein [Candidatus Omnitrophota bacterium]
MNKKGLFNLLRIVISGGLLAFLIWMMRDSFGQVLETIKKADRVTISAGFLVFLAGMMLLGVRLHVIMKSQNIHLPLGRVIYLTFIGQFFSNFLPTAIGGDIVKAFYAARHTGKKLLTVTCIIMDRILGTATIILMLLIVSFFVSESIVNKALFSFLIIAVSGSAVFFIVLFSKKVA